MTPTKYRNRPEVSALAGKPKESAIQKSILALLRVAGYSAWRVNQQGVPLHDGSGGFRPSPTKGMSDIYTIIPPDGRSCWIEVKRPGAKATEAQTDFILTIRERGGLAFVATSAAEVADYLGIEIRETFAKKRGKMR